MRTIDLNTWNRKQHFDHFNNLFDPYFAVTIPVDVTRAYEFSKRQEFSFFAKYLYDCMKAINDIENMRYRIVKDQVVCYDVIHASATIMRSNKTFGFSFVEFDNDLEIFAENIRVEKERIENSTDLYPPTNRVDCIHCSALPWLNFTGHKEPFANSKDSVPKVAFSKAEKIDSAIKMNIAIGVNHALVDGYHVGLFVERFQNYLNN